MLWKIGPVAWFPIDPACFSCFSVNARKPRTIKLMFFYLQRKRRDGAFCAFTGAFFAPAWATVWLFLVGLFALGVLAVLGGCRTKSTPLLASIREAWGSSHKVNKKKREREKRRFGAGIEYCLAYSCPASTTQGGSRPSIFSASGAFVCFTCVCVCAGSG